MPEVTQPTAWWSTPLPDLFFERLRVRKEGLSHDEALKRRIQFGYNELEEHQKITFFMRFVSKVLNPLVILLLIAAGLSALLGQISDFFIIVVMTMMSVIIDSVQEHSATRAAERLRKRVSLTATVVRAGKQEELPFRDIVPGDLILLSAGDIVPADVRLWEAHDLLIDQSTLTGESFPQLKSAETEVNDRAAISDRTNSAYMGTYVVSGEGTGIAVVTGVRTQIGAISKSLVAQRPKTDFEKGMASFGNLLLTMSMIFTAFVFVFHMFLSHDLLSTVLFVLALAIGFAPELLPIVISINLSRGAIRMSKKGVIVKFLPAIETFGSMDILCTDKTGTLTENVIELVRYENIRGKEDPKVLFFGYLASYFQKSVRGPLEDAVMKEKKQKISGYRKISELPFDFFRKRVSVVLKNEGHTFMLTKGAPEDMLSIAVQSCEGDVCTRMTTEMRKKLLHRYNELSEGGFRVLGIARAELPKGKTAFTLDDEKHDLIFLGFLAFLDPPKKTVKTSLSNLASSGVSVKILTGDNAPVTAMVCKEVGLPETAILEAKQIEAMTDKELENAAPGTTAFVRLDPEMKKRVIAALRVSGHVVGYMGDGINDAPALQAADIGISVDNASDIAKESADIILLRKSLHVLSDGVSEGRQTFANVMKYLLMGLSSNFGNMTSLALISVFVPFLPMLPTQILLNDLLYDISQLMLASDRVDRDLLKRPLKWNMKFITRFMLVFGPVSSVFDIVTFFILLKFFHAAPPLFQTGWFLESIVSETLIIFSIRTAVTPFFKSLPDPRFAFTLLAVVAVSLFLPFTALGASFGLIRPPAGYYAVLVGIIVSYLTVTEFMKQWFYRKM